MTTNLLNARDSHSVARGLDLLSRELLRRPILNASGAPISQREADEHLIAVVATTLRAQLCARRLNGVPAWNTPGKQAERLRAELIEHAVNGECLDALRVAAVLYARRGAYGEVA